MRRFYNSSSGLPVIFDEALALGQIVPSGGNVMLARWRIAGILVIIIFVDQRGQGRQTDLHAQALAVRIGAAIKLPGRKVPAGGRPQGIDGAMDTWLAKFPTQGDAACAAMFSPFHAGSQGADLCRQLRGDGTSLPIVDLAAVEGNPEMGAAGTTIEARVLEQAFIGSRPDNLRDGHDVER